MLKFTSIVPLMLGAIVLSAGSGGTAAAQVADRTDIPAHYKWQLNDIYAEESLWQKDCDRLKALTADIATYQGKLANNSSHLLACLELHDQIGIISSKLYAYARMHRDQDATNSNYQALTAKTESLLAEADAATAYIEPELLTIDESTLTVLIAQNKHLSKYQFYFTNLLRQKQHVLSPAEEKLLSHMSELARAPQNIFQMLSQADMKFPVTASEAGSAIELSEGRYHTLIRSSDRNVRRQAFEHLFSTYARYRNTYAATLAGNVKKNLFYAKVRNYPSALDKALESENIPVEVYTNLISTVHNHLDPLQRYVALKKRALQLDEIHMYDLYTPLVQDETIAIAYEDALELVKDSLQPLGSEYGAALSKGLSSGWIDVYENRGKRTGAYCWGVYDVHPFVLLNYNDSYDAMSTLAHEMGHALHSHFSHTSQPYNTASYTIFTAEVASTTNEILLLDYMLAKTTDKKQRMFLINQYLEQVRTTVYRQTMFAEFELLLHQAAEQGQPVTAAMLNALWRDLNIKYYGSDIVYDEQLDVEWARIPHFYTSFYVYQYVTGYSAATALAHQIQQQGAPARERYLTFLKSGGSDYALNLLRHAGVDMATPKPIEITLAKFSDRLAELEQLLAEHS